MYQCLLKLSNAELFACSIKISNPNSYTELAHSSNRKKIHNDCFYHSIFALSCRLTVLSMYASVHTTSCSWSITFGRLRTWRYSITFSCTSAKVEIWVKNPAKTHNSKLQTRENKLRKFSRSLCLFMFSAFFQRKNVKEECFVRSILIQW